MSVCFALFFSVRNTPTAERTTAKQFSQNELDINQDVPTPAARLIGLTLMESKVNQ
jgi:hypothetical protein